MARLSALFLVAVFLIESARADWTVSTAQRESGLGPGVERRHIALTESQTDKGATLDVALFSMKSVTLRVIDNPVGKDDLATAMHRENCLAGVNGGYFDLDDKPVGLLLSHGKVIAPLRKAPLLSGVLVASDGRIQLLRVAEYSPKRRATEARQCGPFLVDRNRPVPGLNNTRSARRTFFILGELDRAAMGVSSMMTLAELGKILGTPEIVADLKVQRALNLDGGSSTAFWFATDSGAFSISEQKIVRDFVAVTRK